MGGYANAWKIKAGRPGTFMYMKKDREGERLSAS